MTRERDGKGRYIEYSDPGRPLSGMILFRVDQPTRQAIATYCRDNDISMSQLMRDITREWMKRLRKPSWIVT